MADVVSEADLADPNPDIEDLFRHYDRLYFQGSLAGAGFTVKWGSSSTLGGRSFGSCTFSKAQNTITLSEPVLKYLSCADRKNALLHQMIHAMIYVKHHRIDRQHGPVFRDWMDAINSCSAKDRQRPDGGYNITTRHDFSPEEPRSFKGILWKCESCGDTLMRARRLGPPSDACCIENVNTGASCGNMLCQWHNHKSDCCGTYEKGACEKMTLESGSPFQKKVRGGAQLLLTSSSDMFKSKEAIQDSSSSALQGNTKSTKPNAEDKHLPLVSGRNGKPQGSSSSTKAGKRCRPEVVLETGILLAESPRKLKGEQDVAAEDDLFSLVIGTIAKSPRSSTSKKVVNTSKKVVKAAKKHEPEDVQKLSGVPASPQKKTNQEHGLVASEKQALLSVEGYNDAISPGSDTSKKAGERHKPDDVQKPSVLPSAPLGITKLHHALVATEKNKLSSAEGYNDAKPQGRKTSKKAGERHEPQIAQKACSPPAYPQKRLKQDLLEPEKKELSHAMGCSNEKILDRSSSRKAHRQHEPEDFRKTTILPATLGNKPKASGFAASKKQRKGKCKTKPAREKEYAVMSAYLDYYESDRSSGSTEPLVNKRTERRRRERERARILTYSRSKKNPAPLVYSRTDASVSNHRIKMLPCKDESMQQSKPPPPCSETAVLTTANQVVVTQGTGNHSQPSAPCLGIVPLQPAAPPFLNPPDQSTACDIIDISDDDCP